MPARRRTMSSEIKESRGRNEDYPPDKDGKALRRDSMDGVATALISDISEEEARLARDQQMDTNPTQRHSLSRTMSSQANVAAALDAAKNSKFPNNKQPSQPPNTRLPITSASQYTNNSKVESRRDIPFGPSYQNNASRHAETKEVY